LDVVSDESMRQLITVDLPSASLDSGQTGLNFISLCLSCLHSIAWNREAVWALIDVAVAWLVCASMQSLCSASVPISASLDGWRRLLKHSSGLSLLVYGVESESVSRVSISRT
jgi:hypothetical protein